MLPLFHQTLDVPTIQREFECLEDGWEQDEINLCFRSIQIAGQTYGLTQGRPSFNECELKFTTDPCTRRRALIL
jgi:hypothetical protein